MPPGRRSRRLLLAGGLAAAEGAAGFLAVGTLLLKVSLQPRDLPAELAILPAGLLVLYSALLLLLAYLGVRLATAGTPVVPTVVLQVLICVPFVNAGLVTLALGLLIPPVLTFGLWAAG